MAIKNIIFDFGDIFINLDKQATLKKMSHFGLVKVTSEMTLMNNQYEKGEINSDTFISFYQSYFPKTSKTELIDAWNAIVLNFPDNRLKFIEQLAKKDNFRLFLLSNTNELHIEKVIENMGLSRYERFKNCFEQFYLSHEIKMRKPDTEIYQFVIETNGLNNKETLFVDDTKENTEAAGHLKIKTWHLKVGEEDVIDILKSPIFSE
ncbi:HAD-IA family hydrolase [Spongiivirga sp. MCCC 1A20706]|uniref:HAD-IA family hydrolase n=1 Tax=Spongiivirga sp. MCCC 1A20706 TaxID=3160963 RepID=UPI003977C1B4